MTQIPGFAAQGPAAPLGPFSFERRDVGPTDIMIDILYCGVCHSDIHTVRSEWAGTVYPCVPGHEIIGRVLEAGSAAAGFKPGDLVGVGCMVDSCQECAHCAEGLEQYCEKGMTGTYNSPDRHTGGVTYGGYSKAIVVDKTFVLRISEKLDAAAAAPLLCAGITTWSPLRHWKVGPGTNVGVVGLGGLGHMAIKLAHALGAHVVLFTTSPSKADDARALGADEVVISKDPDAMAARRNSLDLIINTVAASHDLDPFLSTLALDGVMVLVGAPAEPHPSPTVFNLIGNRRSLAGSLIGGIAETQEMLDFCAEHGIVSEVEVIPIQQINEAYERMIKGDVKYRFVIDMSTLA